MIAKLYLKELKGYFNSPTAYIFLIVYLVLCGVIMFILGDLFDNKEATLIPFFSFAPIAFLIFIPAVAMRLWAEENRSGTVELLMTLPIRDVDAVVGKFLAALTVIFAAVTLTVPIPMALKGLIDPKSTLDLGPVVGGYISLYLIGAAFLSVCLMISALSRNQIVAFILGVVGCFALYVMGLPQVQSYFPYWLQQVLAFVGVGGHIENTMRGVLDSRDILYYVSLAVLAIFITTRLVESRRWR